MLLHVITIATCAVFFRSQGTFRDIRRFVWSTSLLAKNSLAPKCCNWFFQSVKPFRLLTRIEKKPDLVCSHVFTPPSAWQCLITSLDKNLTKSVRSMMSQMNQIPARGHTWFSKMSLMNQTEKAPLACSSLSQMRMDSPAAQRCALEMNQMRCQIQTNQPVSQMMRWALMLKVPGA